MTIHHINCGTLCPISEKGINGDGSLLGRGEIPCNCLLIEHETGLILVDAGLGQKDLEHPAGRIPGGLMGWFLKPALIPTETAFAQVLRLGYQPSDVRHIILTHLDFDTAGGISDFPNATVHVWDREYVQAMSPKTFMDKIRYSHDQIAVKRDWKYYRQELKWFGFDSAKIEGLEDEFRLVSLPGHSAGHCGVAIHLNGQWLLHCGDAVFNHEELESDPHCPFMMAAYEFWVQYEGTQRMETAQKLRDLAVKERGQVQIMCSHDPVAMDPFRVLGTKRAYVS